MCVFKIYVKIREVIKLLGYVVCVILFFKKETKELRYTNQRKQLFKKSDTNEIWQPTYWS